MSNESFWYVTKRSGINFYEKAVKKPTYLFLAVILYIPLFWADGAFCMGYQVFLLKI